MSPHNILESEPYPNKNSDLQALFLYGTAQSVATQRQTAYEIPSPITPALRLQVYMTWVQAEDQRCSL